MGSDLVCPYENCGKEFKQPVLLFNEAALHETYYACPHCHSKLNHILQDAKNFSTVKAVASIDAKAYLCKEERPENCPHHIGYLKTLPENESLPEGCLTCPKAIVCIAKTGKS